MLAGADMTLGESLDRHGISGRIREEVMRPFFRLVFADEDLRTSYQYAMLGMQALLIGMPSLPALGMQALPNQLALSLEHPVEHGVDVLGVERSTGDGVRIHTDGGQIQARAAVVATDPDDGVVAAGSRHPRDAGTLHLVVRHRRPADDDQDAVREPDGPGDRPDLARAGGLQRRAALRAPRPAPGLGVLDRRCRPRRSGMETEAEVRAQLAQIFRTDTSKWGLVTRNSHSAAWPAARPPLIMGREVDLGDGLFVAGDHRETPSIPGAMRSGQRAAAAVLEELGEPRPTGSTHWRRAGRHLLGGRHRRARGPRAPGRGGYAGRAGPRRWPRPRG